MRPMAALALFAVLVSPSGAAHNVPMGTPTPFRNQLPSALADIDLPAYVLTNGSATDLLVHVRIRDASLVERAMFLMFAFNLKSSLSHVEFTSLEAANRTSIPLTRDERRSNPLQPRVMVDPANLTTLDVVLRGRAWADVNGQFHVGVLAIAFDHQWGTLQNESGERAEAYAFTLMGVDGKPGTRLGAPFQGQGNPAWLVGIVALAIVGVVTLAARHYLRRRTSTGPPRAQTPGP